MITYQRTKQRVFSSADFTVNDGKVLPQYYFTNPIELFNQLAFWLSLPRWTAAQAAALIVGENPKKRLSDTLEMLGDINIRLSADDLREKACIRNVQVTKERILDAAQAYDNVQASPSEWISFAGDLGITPGWYQFAINEELWPSDKGQEEPLAPTAIETPREKLEGIKDEISSGAKIPGKIPRIAIGKLAVKAAWQIECETRKRATAKQVIEKLQSWVDGKDNPNAIAELTKKTPSGVKWVTSGGKEKCYDARTCQKTLENWNKTRT